ncbi:hypothetical protein [Natrinema sp. 1APR25-10V2]|uniref:hypothetical protein n=1 Tax=Natrinema sp. 1APR25-10V2 TaxID=2951081 RepID=UPI0028745EBD|nr:hypothetical protein [Natrinema sp. 1APR25-10V2]MDS0475522.1 hypothetical protein [Natrinema sp. 1APR25-10V2]
MTASNSESPPSSSAVPDRMPRLWTLWAAARPSQLGLIAVVYALGVGMATAGPPLVAPESAPVDANSAPFFEAVSGG